MGSINLDHEDVSNKRRVWAHFETIWRVWKRKVVISRLSWAIGRRVSQLWAYYEAKTTRKKRGKYQ